MRLILFSSLLVEFLWAGQPPRPALRTRIALDESIREPPDLMKLRHHMIGGMSFSHSGTKIALAAVGHSHDANGLIHIVIVDLDHPQPAVRAFDSTTQKDIWHQDRRLKWSEDDSLLLLQNGLEEVMLIDAGSGAVRCS